MQTKTQQPFKLFFQCLLLTLLCLLCHCEKNHFSVEPDQSQKTEKDGIITFHIMEQVFDSTKMNLTWKKLERLDVSETDNVIDIPNAIPFELTKLNGVTFWFFGDFHGVQDSIFIWSDYRSPYSNHEREIAIDPVGDHQGLNIMVAEGAPIYGPVRGFIFILDTDNDNHGTGYVIIKAESLLDTIWVDAAINTVNYAERAALKSIHLDRELKDPLVIQSNDLESYSRLKDQAFWILIYNSNTETKIRVGTSFILNPLNTNQFQFYGFAPNFIVEDNLKGK